MSHPRRRVSNLSHLRRQVSNLSHLRRQVPNFLFLLALFVALPAHAFTVEIPDFEVLERKLQLRQEQKAQFHVAVQATQRALLSVALVGLEIKERLRRELAKPVPDFGSLYEGHQQLYEQVRPHFLDARREWSKLYAMMDPRQVATARAFIDEKLDLMMPKWH